MSFKEVVNIMETRIEYDSMGPVEVDARRIYGPQTQRSFNNFKIGDHRIPIEQIKACRNPDTAISYIASTTFHRKTSVSIRDPVLPI